MSRILIDFIKYYFPLIVFALVLLVIGYFKYLKDPTTFCVQKSYFKDNKAVNDSFIQSKLEFFRQKLIQKVHSQLPSPHAELVLGMVLGVDLFAYLPKFKQVLKDTGTIHVVVVSGYNISMVYNLVIRLLGSRFSRRNILIGIFVTLFYSLLTGFEPPVIRAWLMSSTSAVSKLFGNTLDTLRVLISCALLMCLYDICYINDVSFQLSFLATLGLVTSSSSIHDCLIRKFKHTGSYLEDLSTTLSAQIYVVPYIAYKFSTFSTLSILVNVLVLWLVPVITLLGFIYILLLLLIPKIAFLLSILIYYLCELFIETTYLFSLFKFGVLKMEIALFTIFSYYVVLGVVTSYLSFNAFKKS